MEIQIAEFAGFCEGVERAYQIALDAVRTEKTPLYMLGQLVHNKQVIEKLKALGVIIVPQLPKSKKKGYLLISAHGVPSDIIKKAEKKGLTVIDTSCPWVQKAQSMARLLKENGFYVIIIGDKKHPEVKGLKSYAGSKSLVIQKPEELKKLPPKKLKIGIVSQTTQTFANFEAIVKKVKALHQGVEITAFNTICGATARRQNAATALAKQVELMLVIGDKKSANTKRLAEVCSHAGAKTYKIQTVRELKKSWLKGINKIGLTAGASTPEWIIEEVVSFLQRFPHA
jgi:4-hydroxy-3-methylbut-2-enyl diphosphate reductase